MQTILIVGSDTGVGKTQVTAALAKLLSEDGARIQIVKPVETGSPEEGDAVRARRLSGTEAATFTLQSFRAPLAPATAAALEHQTIELSALTRAVRALPECDWRLIETAGGVATPIDERGHDWTDFGRELVVDAVVVVVGDRLGAINQGRLAWLHALRIEAPTGVWINALEQRDGATLSASNRDGLRSVGVPIWAELAFEAVEPRDPEIIRGQLSNLGSVNERSQPSVVASTDLSDRCRTELAKREKQGLRRVVRTSIESADILNLADNDYLALASDPALADAAAHAAKRFGTSASASPLVTGWREPHEALVHELCDWHGFSCGLLWSSGYAANSAVLSVLPQRGDLVLADRLVHHSMIAGLLHSGARLQRYEHLRLDQLGELLAKYAPEGRSVFVVTESVFSMDGDYPSLTQLADLKKRFGFCLIIDEAHALGWYGSTGAGMVHAAGLSNVVDIFIGTLGKTLASGGAYSLFHDSILRDYLINHAGEFIYSTALSPLCVATASAAVQRVRELAPAQPQWHAASRALRARLAREEWTVPAGDSPIVPVQLGSADAVLALSHALREKDILVSAIRPPTVPVGTSRLRLSLKRTFDAQAEARLCSVMNEWRKRP